MMALAVGNQGLPESGHAPKPFAGNASAVRLTVISTVFAYAFTISSCFLRPRPVKRSRQGRGRPQSPRDAPDLVTTCLAMLRSNPPIAQRARRRYGVAHRRHGAPYHLSDLVRSSILSPHLAGGVDLSFAQPEYSRPMLIGSCNCNLPRLCPALRRKIP